LRTLASEVLTAVDAMSQTGKWAHLYDVVVDSTTTLRLTDYPLALTFNALTYSPYPIFCGDLPQTSKPEMQTFQVNVANIDRSIALYLEGGKILGNDVTITWVFIREADDTVVSAFAEIYQALSAEMSDDAATVAFEVGKYNLFSIQLPRNRWVDLRCEHVYKKVGTCDYGRDEFMGLSEINLKVGGDGDKKDQGWRVLNMAGMSVADIDISTASYLSLVIPKVSDLRWSPAQKDGPFVYRKLHLEDTANVSGDFDVEVKLGGDIDEVGEAEGILITTDSDTTADWVFFARKFFSSAQGAPTFFRLKIQPVRRNDARSYSSGVVTDLSVPSLTLSPSRRYRRWGWRRFGSRSRTGLTMQAGIHLVVYSVAAGVETTKAFTLSSDAFLRVQKIGTTYRFYHRPDESSTWSDLGLALVRSELHGVVVRMGVAAETDSATRVTPFTAKADYWHLLSGGYLTCPRTIAACKTRENTRRFGGAPGIIHGPLVL